MPEELQKIRLEGNRLFAEKNWSAAVNKYTECIDQTLWKRSPQKPTQENSSLFLMLAYSNRAEARLRLLRYEDAFSDVEKALEIEPTHVKTLVRKGKAAHGLGLFEKACQAFKAALAKSPKEQSIERDLTASTAALKQSRTGQYVGLTDFFLRGSTGEAPSCADFVGPVEIRRVGYGRGRRGLFATRNLKPGELLLLSNPLAVFRQSSRAVPPRNDSCAKSNLISELLKRIRTSKRQRAQLNSLCGLGKNEMDIPSMDLFRAESEWLPEGWEKIKMDADHITEIVSLNAVGNLTEQFCLENGALAPGEGILGIWALPSFTNHSCSPNICRSYIGDAVSFRASENIVKGEELTVSYLSELILLHERAKSRQSKTREWCFTCKCARCLLEERLRPKLSKMITKAHSSFSHSEWLVTADVLINEVEAVIQFHCSTLVPKEHGWIRVIFFMAYAAKFRMAQDKGDLKSSMSALRLVLDLTTAVCVGPLALTRAVVLLQLIEKRYSKRSEIYTVAFDRVLGICEVCFGEERKDILPKLTNAVIFPFGSFLA